MLLLILVDSDALFESDTDVLLLIDSDKSSLFEFDKDVLLLILVDSFVLFEFDKDVLALILCVVLRAKCKNVANKMQKIGFKKRHFKRLLNAK